MRMTWRRGLLVAMLALGVLAAIPAALWLLLTHEPDFYRVRTSQGRGQKRHEARQFVAQSLQLRNDIINEERWEALFSDEEVNAWLAEDLVVHFADQIPQGVCEPRVVFEPDRAILAFRLNEGPIRSVIWVVAQIRVPEPNVIALTIEKIRAGVIPVAADSTLAGITQHLRARGIDVRWERDGPYPVARIRYRPHLERRDVVLENFQIQEGHVRLTGRSERSRVAARLGLPSARLLQATFPLSRTIHRSTRDAARSDRRSSRSPAS